MNHYAQALAELQAQPDHELKQIGDQWQTPKALAWGLFHQFAPTLGPVVLDMFADDCNHLVPNYYDAEDNALTQELAADLRRLGGAAYANPPYSRPCMDSEGNPITGMEAILNYCREQRALGAKIMLLIKAATSETWWPEDADFIQFVSGRIGFEVPSWYVPRDPKKDKPSSSGFASAVVIFDAGWQGERRPEARLRRDDLITTGTIILDMIHRQAVELTLAADHAIRSAAPKLAPVVIQEQPAKTEPAAGEPPAADGNEASALEIEPLHDWQQHPAIKSVIYQIDEADLLTPANTRLLAGYIRDLQDGGIDQEPMLKAATQMAKHLLGLAHDQLPLTLDNGEAA
ncbi:DNA N-6-adenine-methyltransferase (Dam) [compost metagenome]